VPMLLLIRQLILWVLLFMVSNGCSIRVSAPEYLREYAYNKDGAGDQLPDVSRLQPLVPVVEPKSKYGNPSSYKVFGKTYYVMSSATGYRETGIASWYGKKFHGERTSSGEIYDMYAISAAHKSLPLPTYVRVTNLENQRSLIVRVNDRGPFHSDRIIDLSYAAAYQLGYLAKGTAKVRVEAIDPARYRPLQDRNQQKNNAKSIVSDTLQKELTDKAVFVQIGAYGEIQNARKVQARLVKKGLPVKIVHYKNGNKWLKKVLIGPLHSLQSAESLLPGLRREFGAGVHLVD